MRVLTTRLGQLVLAGSVATTSLVLGAENVAAVNPGPIQTPFSVLRDPGPVQCPDGLELAPPADAALGGRSASGSKSSSSCSRRPGRPAAPRV